LRKSNKDLNNLCKHVEDTSTETTMDVLNHFMKERDKFNKKVMEDEQMLEAGKPAAVYNKL
jgi:hypothetical protein